MSFKRVTAGQQTYTFDRYDQKGGINVFLLGERYRDHIGIGICGGCTVDGYVARFHWNMSMVEDYVDLSRAIADEKKPTGPCRVCRGCCIWCTHKTVIEHSNVQIQNGTAVPWLGNGFSRCCTDETHTGFTYSPWFSIIKMYF